MNVTETLAARRTVRAFRPDAVPRETVAAILGAALHAPSWANTQPWEVFVAAGATIERLRTASLERTHQGVPGGGCRAVGPTRLLDLPMRLHSSVNSSKTTADSSGRPSSSTYAWIAHSRPGRSSTWDRWAQSVMLAAQDQGVDSAVAVNLVVYPDLVRAELGIPEELLVLIGIALGYADPEDPEREFRSSRRTLEEAVRFCDL